MPKISIPIAQGFYQSPSVPVANQRCVNLRPNIAQVQSPFQETLFGTHGITKATSTGRIKQVNRGAHVKDGKPYVVNGETLYRIDFSISADGQEVYTPVELGSIPGSGRCSFADNGKQLLVLVPGGNGYIIDETALPVFQQITDTDFTTTNGVPQHVRFIAGYFVVSTDSKKFIISALNDGLTWSALDFGSAEADPDDIVSPHVFRNQLFICGSQTIEAFDNIGGAGFPFQRSGNFVIPKGLSSPYAIVNTSDAFMWLGADENETPSIWALSGASPVKVSTTAIDKIISGLTDDEILQCFAWSYAESGAFYVGFTFPNITVCYDVTTQRWHERESNIINSKGFTETARWRVNAIAKAYGKLLVADSQDGRIGILSEDVYKEYERPIVAYFTTLPLYNQGQSLSVTQAELVLEAGTGDDPEVRMRVSQNGRVFNDSLTRSFGELGAYESRAIWHRLGRFAQSAVFEFSISDPVKRAVLALNLKIRSGRGR